MSKVKPESFVTIQGWMVTDLNLSGNDLLVYAVIYGFSQDGEDWFEGSRQYLADWCGSTVKGISKNLNNLLDWGLIEKKDVSINGVKFCNYRSTLSSLPGNSVPYPPEQSSPHNIVHNNSKKKELSISNDIDSEKEKKRFVPPTEEEVLTYMREYIDKKQFFVEADAEGFIDFYTSKNWYVGKNKMSDWKSAARRWVSENAKRSSYRKSYVDESFDNIAKWGRELSKHEHDI